MASRDDTTLGNELRLTLLDCDPQWLNSVEKVSGLVRDLCERLDVTIRSTVEHQFEPQGISVVAILAESHCAVHTWPEEGKATVDIFSCGPADPVEVVPMLVRAFNAQDIRVEVSERAAVSAPSTHSYPNFPEYILREPPYGHFPVTTFRRGVGREYILEPEAVSWQKFFTSSDYEPPAGTDILLLHPCSWAKPYDFSHFITRLRSVTDRFPRVHRAVISNVGVVPFEYQMNDFFCSYDYMDLDADRPVEDKQSIADDFTRITAQRISDYIGAHSTRYRAVVILGHPFANGYQAAVQQAAVKAGLPGFQAPSVDTYHAAQVEVSEDRDWDAPLFADRSLDELAQKLTMLVAAVDRREAADAH